LLAILVWTAIIGVSVDSNIGREHEKVLDLAKVEAHANLNKDRAFRLWASSKDGIYLPVDEKNQPNPYLAHLSDRDLSVKGGPSLTLINPATMLREIGEQHSQLYGVKAKITGKKVLNAVNLPDPWEFKALETFERLRQKEVVELAEINGKGFLRVMQPMYMEPDCLKCHGISGVKAGELGGATGVSIPLEPYYRIERDSVANMLGTHGTLWLAGLGLIGFVSHRSKRHEVERTVTETELRKLSRAVEQSATSVLITNVQGEIQYVNPKFCEVTGYALTEVLGKTPRILKSGETDLSVYQEMWAALLAGKEWRGEYKNRKKNGELFWCLESISGIKDSEGAVTHFVAVIEDISERKFNEETIRHLAYFDPLTELPNRRHFQEQLEQATAWCSRSDCQLALLYIDLDRFKTANDTLGHAVGDELLKIIGQRLVQGLREGDIVARLGGDEFAVIATNIHRSEDAANVAEKIIEGVRQPLIINGHELYITTSVGISLYPADTADLDELVKNADIALYHAKERGKNTFQFYSEKINELTVDRLRIESDLRKAIERSELFLEFQPQIDLNTGQVYGVEALLRWQHPVHGLIPPGKFIPLAEETNLIVPIGDWVIQTACQQLKKWDDAGLSPLSMAVNLSAVQFRREGFLDSIRRMLEESGVDSGRLELEITESALMKNPEEAGSILRSLREMGVKVSIDDFGTGYSSLSYLKRFPVSILKIDQSFVREIVNSSDDQAIAEAVIALAKGMNLMVVAEGVETETQLKILKVLECDKVQGYFFSRPISPDAIASFVETGVRKYLG